jgi:hypothetical protein
VREKARKCEDKRWPSLLHGKLEHYMNNCSFWIHCWSVKLVCLFRLAGSSQCKPALMTSLPASSFPKAADEESCSSRTSPSKLALLKRRFNHDIIFLPIFQI